MMKWHFIKRKLSKYHIYFKGNPDFKSENSALKWHKNGNFTCVIRQDRLFLLAVLFEQLSNLKNFKYVLVSQWSHHLRLGTPICGLDPGNNLTHLFLHWVFNKTFLNINCIQIDIHVLFPMEMSTTNYHKNLMGFSQRRNHYKCFKGRESCLNLLRIPRSQTNIWPRESDQYIFVKLDIITVG